MGITHISNAADEAAAGGVVSKPMYINKSILKLNIKAPRLMDILFTLLENSLFFQTVVDIILDHQGNLVP